MKFDLTNVSDQGFVILPPDRYAVVTTDEWWVRKKEETNNIVVDVDVAITAGKFAGETIRYFHTITNDDQTLGFLLQFLRRIGVIRDGDRDAKGRLTVEFDCGKPEEKDSKGRTRIKSILINGEPRPVAGYKAIAVVTERLNEATGEKRTYISGFEPVEQEPPAGGGSHSQGASSAGGKKPNWPF